MPRLALGLAYDGSVWQGWQTQPHRQTVQDTLEAALHQFLATPVATVCAGRTDTGVHAAMQVIHLDTDVQRRPESWVRGLNALLPPSIAVRWATPVADAFHARFSALSRTYTYLLWNDRVRPALWAGRAGWCFQPLDVDAMRAAAAQLLGEHDFSSFRSSQCQARHPVRTLHQLDIAAQGRFLVFTLRANAFLHHMVRNIMGALLQIGQGRQAVPWMSGLLAARDRKLGAPTFMPDGLYLSAIEYAPDFGLDDLDGRKHLLAPFA
ncbi:tRNA pseudouridine(38-40) synthase TruA [Bordetella sputigena]|uniref:tRNA pseudouridine(38-40) synthase TruA n=1 Tax=Bordetella sputigena TaxID=1416810 RepID=UPI0039EF28CF